MLWGRKVWRTPDDAIRESFPIFKAKAIRTDVERVQGGSEEQGELVEAKTQVHAVFGMFSEEEQAMLWAYAEGFGYSEIARRLNLSRPTVRKRHRAARDRLTARLIELERLVVDPVSRAS